MQSTIIAEQKMPSVEAQGGGTPFLEVRNLEKRFGGVRALKGVSFTIERGRTYHLMGENGCGKSTLIKIISGAQPADGGELAINGKKTEGLTPIGALAAGIETVYQDLSLLPNLSVEENVALTQQLVASNGRLARRLDLKVLRETSIRALKEVGLPTEPAFLSTPVEELPIATRQLIAIARAIASDAGLVIMDEPTTALTRREVDNLIRVVHGLHAKGVSVLFVTHKLDECKAIGGQAIIMRDGLKVAECDVSTQSKSELGFWMTGKKLDETRYRATRTGTRRCFRSSNSGGAASTMSASRLPRARYSGSRDCWIPGGTSLRFRWPA
ncbi:ABC-type sugar transport system ATPase subunit [Sinorhizobium medicae]